MQAPEKITTHSTTAPQSKVAASHSSTTTGLTRTHIGIITKEKTAIWEIDTTTGAFIRLSDVNFQRAKPQPRANEWPMGSNTLGRYNYVRK